MSEPHDSDPYQVGDSTAHDRTGRRPPAAGLAAGPGSTAAPSGIPRLQRRRPRWAVAPAPAPPYPGYAPSAPPPAPPGYPVAAPPGYGQLRPQGSPWGQAPRNDGLAIAAWCAASRPSRSPHVRPRRSSWASLGLVFGLVADAQDRSVRGALTGRGMALAGAICGGSDWPSASATGCVIIVVSVTDSNALAAFTAV